MSLITSFFVCSFYGISSMSLSFSNKFLFQMYSFKSIYILLLMQQLFILPFSVLFISLGKFQFKLSFLKNIFPLSILTLINISCGITALSKVNIPMFLALRRTSLLFIIVVDIIIKKKFPPIFVVISTIVIVIGAIIAGINDLNYDPVGYAFIFFNNLFTAIHLTVINYIGQKQKVTSLQILIYNAINMIPFMVIMSYYYDEYNYCYQFDKKYDTGFIVNLIFSSASGILITFSQNLCSIYNSASSTAITVLGICLSLFGAGIYSAGKIIEENKKKKELLERTTKKED